MTILQYILCAPCRLIATDVFLEMIGFDQADIRRIKSQEQRARGQKVLQDMLEEEESENEGEK